MLSAPENAWNAGKAFAFSGPNAVHIGLIYWTPETIEIEVFFGNKSQLATIKTRTSVSAEKNVNSASFEFRSVADTPKHIIKVSASSWLLFGKGPTSLLLLVWPAAEVMTSMDESLL